MVDCHMHMVLDGVYWRAALDRHAQGPDIPWIRQALERYRQQGFTWLRDCGDRWGVGAAARTLAPEYGITYRTCLASLYMQGHYGGIIGLSFADEREFTALVRENKARGADFIKIMISGLMDFDHFGVLTEESLEPKQIRRLADIAHGEGMAVAVHGNGARGILAAAEAGVESVEHGAYAHGEALAAMAEMGTVWVPTLSTVGNLRGKGRFSPQAVERILENALENVAAFAQMGGLLAPGTDAGAWQVPHGTHSEYELLAQALGGDPEPVLAPGIRRLRAVF